jgi:hypothetical protein
MQQVDRAGAVRAFPMDDRKQRLIVTGDDGDRLGFLGWEVADAAALDALAARLDAHGIKVRRAPAPWPTSATWPISSSFRTLRATGSKCSTHLQSPVILSGRAGRSRGSARARSVWDAPRSTSKTPKRICDVRKTPPQQQRATAAPGRKCCGLGFPGMRLTSDRFAAKPSPQRLMWPTDGDGKRIVQHSVAVSQ